MRSRFTKLSPGAFFLLLLMGQPLYPAFADPVSLTGHGGDKENVDYMVMPGRCMRFRVENIVRASIVVIRKTKPKDNILIPDKTHFELSFLIDMTQGDPADTFDSMINKPIDEITRELAPGLGGRGLYFMPVKTAHYSSGRVGSLFAIYPEEHVDDGGGIPTASPGQEYYLDLGEKTFNIFAQPDEFFQPVAPHLYYRCQYVYPKDQESGLKHELYPGYDDRLPAGK